MSELRKLIKVADLEQKMEMILFNGRGPFNEICDECNGLMIVHQEGSCTRSNGDQSASVLILQAELNDEVSGFMKR